MTARQQAVTWGRRLAAMTWKEILQLSRDVPLLLFLLYSFSLSVVVLSLIHILSDSLPVSTGWLGERRSNGWSGSWRWPA